MHKSFCENFANSHDFCTDFYKGSLTKKQWWKRKVNQKNVSSQAFLGMKTLILNSLLVMKFDSRLAYVWISNEVRMVFVFTHISL